MKKSALLFLSVLSFTIAKSQTLEWAKHISSSYGQTGAISTDDLGNVYSTGSAGSTAYFDFPSLTPSLSPVQGGFSYLIKADSSGNYKWLRQLNGNSGFLALQTSQAGNLYTSGYFTDTVDFDPGPGFYKIGSGSLAGDAFVAKYDTAGNFLWAKNITGTEAQSFSLTVDDSDNVFVSGFFTGTADFDPGAAVYNVTSNGGDDIFMVKLDAAGNFAWVKTMGGTGRDRANGITMDHNGYLYLTGRFEGTADLDPGAGLASYTAVGSDDAFTAKFDTAGNFIWTKHISGTGEEYGNSIATDESGNCYVAGLFNTTTNFDPGITNLTLPTAGSLDIFIAKYNAAGNLIWIKNIGGMMADYPNSIVYNNSNIYIAGLFTGYVDFDPGAGVFSMNTGGSGNAFIYKLSASGDFGWARKLSSNYDIAGTVAHVDPFNNVYAMGHFEFYADVDPSVTDTLTFVDAAGDQDFFMIKLDQEPCSNMTVVLDSYSPVSCSAPGHAYTHAVSGMAPYTYSWDTTPALADSAIVFSDAGTYQLTVTDSNMCVKTLSLLVGAPDSATGFDLNSNLVATGFRPGFNSAVWINAYNNNCMPASGTLELVIDTSLVTITNTFPSPDAILNDTVLVWNFSNLAHDSMHLAPQVYFHTNDSASIGDTVCFKTFVYPVSGDLDSVNNKKEYCFPVINGYDPNDKSVYPQGDCAPGYIANGQLLTYTVRFQNTGNADAVNISVLDTLDTNLDLNTVRVVGNSHAVVTEILPGNVLKFRFNDIHLPDSLSNEQQSHGYVIFEAMPLPGLANGTQIKNNAGIYFDYNPPVYTNTVLNTISDGMFDNAVSTSGNTISAHLSGGSYQWINCTTGDSIAGATSQNFTASVNGNYAVIISDGCYTDTSSCVAMVILGINTNNPGNAISIYPNPATNTITISSSQPVQLNIVNLLGETVISKALEKELIIDISGLSKGIYFIQTTEGFVQKLVKQ